MKAAVLPVPVRAEAITSRPARIVGIDRAWIGVGTPYPHWSRAFMIGEANFRFSKDIMVSFCFPFRNGWYPQCDKSCSEPGKSKRLQRRSTQGCGVGPSPHVVAVSR